MVATVLVGGAVTVVLGLAGREEHRDLVAAALQRAAARLRALPENGRAWGVRHRVDLRHAMSALVPNANVLGGQSGGDFAHKVSDIAFLIVEWND